jgi:hypothetical protein
MLGAVHRSECIAMAIGRQCFPVAQIDPEFFRD